VILVMSNAFARSEWCQFEALLAHERFLKNGSDTLATVLLEDVSSRHFTNALNIILTATTYPIWSEKQEHLVNQQWKSELITIIYCFINFSLHCTYIIYYITVTSL
jgi:hypothetical protein